MCKLGNLYKDYDALMVKANPLVITREGERFVLYAVLQVDDSSLFKHPELQAKAIKKISDESEREG